MLSIITVCKNGKDTIAQCVSSVLKNMNQDMEYIVIDGDSTDKTLEIVQKMTAGQKNVRIYSESDQGVYEAMNKGLHKAKGKFVYYLNCDDWLLPGSLQKLLDFSKNHAEVDCIYGDMKTSTIPGEVHPWIYKACRRPERILDNMVFCHQSIICSREKMLEIGGFDLQYEISSDWDLMIRLYQSGAIFAYVNVVIAVYSLLGVSSVAENRQILLEEKHRIRENYGRCHGFDWRTKMDEILWKTVFGTVIKLFSEKK